MGDYHTAKKTTGLGKIDTLELHDITVHNVPVFILGTKHFTEDSSDNLHVINGVIGTSVLEQFLPTVDYLNNKLILRRKTQENRKKVSEEYANHQVKTIPFYLDSLHLLYAKGSINGRENVLFFVDSGLADDASHNAFIMPTQTFDYLNLPLPEVIERKETKTGAGVVVEYSGYFSVETIGLEGLVRQNMTGLYIADTEASYWEQGFISDALISHNYLKNYIWTIDFDKMEMIFAR